jgi:hypothetical protein
VTVGTKVVWIDLGKLGLAMAASIVGVGQGVLAHHLVPGGSMPRASGRWVWGCETGIVTVTGGRQWLGSG